MIKERFSILIISFYFPPYPKVGGRRWAKFSKYLQRRGYDIHILCAKFKEHTKSSWQTDIKEINNINRLEYLLNDKLFKKIDLENANLIQKILWHFSKKKHNIFNKSNSPVIDLSIGKEKDFLKKAIEIINKKDIKEVVLTAGPFSYAYYLNTLKDLFPNINFGLDLRDYWSSWMTDENGIEITSEKKKEQITFEKFDWITMPCRRMVEHYKNKYPILKDKMFWLPHAFDIEDLNIPIKSINSGNLIRIAYAGGLYANMNSQFNELLFFVKKCIIKDINIKVDLFCYYKNYEDSVKEMRLDKHVKFLEPVSNKTLLKLISEEYTHVLYMRSDVKSDEHIFSTKFFDYLLVRKPIIYVGKEGDVSDFIRDEKVGLILNDYLTGIENFIVKSNNISKDLKNKKLSDFSIEKTTDKLINILDSYS